MIQFDSLLFGGIRQDLCQVAQCGPSNSILSSKFSHTNPFLPALDVEDRYFLFRKQRFVLYVFASYCIEKNNNEKPLLPRIKRKCCRNVEKAQREKMQILKIKAFIHLQCNELNRGHPTFFVAPFSKYLVAFSMMEINFRPKSLICDWSEMNELRFFCSELVL